MRILAFLVNIYMIILLIRIVLSWLHGLRTGGLQEFLVKITDPYLNWFRRFPVLQVGFLDLSPVVALGVLSVVLRILRTLAIHGRISVGIILTIALIAVWSAVAFFLGFLIIVLVLRLIAHLINHDGTNTFWRIVEAISQPVLYRINRFIFRDRIVNYLSGIIISIVSLGLIYLVLRIIVSILAAMLVRIPI